MAYVTTSTTSPQQAATANENSKAPRTGVTVIIPARGGSKGVPLKNLRPIAGRSLVGRAVDAALATESVTSVYVSTDHPGIADEARRCGAGVIERPASLSGDTASSESALLHALEILESRGERPAVTVLVQCTSPFIRPEDLQAAVTAVETKSADVAFSTVEDHGFLWTRTPNGSVTAVGHQVAYRPRRQDRAPQMRETGAFYAMNTEGFLETRHRFFGTLTAIEVPAWTAPEIDSLDDLEHAIRIAELHEAPVQALDVDALIMDFDGVHTDDSVTITQDGTESVKVSRSDGMGIKMLRQAGVPMVIVSTETNPVVTARGKKLKVEVMQGIEHKADAVANWIKNHGLDPARVAFLGNDINDLPAFAEVGWPLAVADAQPVVARAARVTISNRGGHGAVREVCDRILAARNENRDVNDPAGLLPRSINRPSTSA